MFVLAAFICSQMGTGGTKMKCSRFFLVITLITLLFFTVGSPLSARAAEDPDTVQLKVDNKTGQAVYLNLKGPRSYYQTVAPGITKLAILILAALNIANENFDLKMNLSELLEEISERSAGLIRKLDECLR